jgi:hypothetical protein
MDRVASRFRPAWDAVAALASDDRYLGALVFGSVAEGTASDDSDLDVRVVVDGESSCASISHPRIGGVKLDVTFATLGVVAGQSEREIARAERRPMIAGAQIVFDKTGELAALVDCANAVQAPAYDPAEAPLDRFMLHHANDKVERALEADPESALYSMHATIGDVLAIHYRVHGRFRVSSKKLLADLARWDAPLASLVRRFVAAPELDAKFDRWTQILDHVSEPLGGRPPIEENLCDCAACRADLAALLTVRSGCILTR